MYHGGANGWDKLILKACVNKSVPFILRLSFKTDYDRLQDFVNHKLCLLATWEKEKYTGRRDNGIYFKRNLRIIEDAKRNKKDKPRIGCYWDGRKTGGTYNSIKSAIVHNCLVFNYFNLEEIHFF